MLSTYTTPDSVRAVLGVADDEVTDDMLALPLYEVRLVYDLEEIDSGIPEAYKTTVAIDYTTRTAAEKRFCDAVKLFSAYSVARTALSSLPYLADKRITDGRAESERIADPFSLVREAVSGGLLDLRYKVSAAYAALPSVTTEVVTRTARTMLASTGIAVDPVTNT